MAFDLPDIFATNDVVTAAKMAKYRNSIIANAYAYFKMGGSRSVALTTGGGYIAIPDWEDFSITSTDYTNHVYKLVWEVFTENAATTVTVKLRNITDSSDAYVSSAVATTAWGTEQVSTAITIAASKVYRVQASKSDDAVDCWVMARFRRTHA